MSVIILKSQNAFSEWNAAILLVCVSVASLFFFKNKPKRDRLPPGPKGLPVLGYLPFVGKYPERHFKELGNKYGSVFGLQIGTRYFVVINDYETIIDLYRRDAASGRPPYVFHNWSEHENLAGMNGNLWKEHRKFFLNFLRGLFRSDVGLGNLHTILNIEVTALLATIEASITKGIQKMNVTNALRELTNNVLLRSVFSITLSNDDRIIWVMAEQQTVILNQAIPSYLTTCFPELRWLLRRIMPSQKVLKRTSREVHRFVRNQIEEHRKTLDEDNPRDYLDHFLIKQKSNLEDPFYSDEYLNSNSQILMTGGVDTTRTAMEWMLMFLAKFPDVQEKIFNEIYRAFGAEQRPEWDDRYLTPFSMATIYECHRWKTIVPINSMRMAKEDLPVKDYVIPKGSYILSNNWAVHNDEQHWKDASEFNPNRYLDKAGKLNLNERMLAFSIGKRDCPGKQQALIEQYGVLMAVLQKYKINAPPEGISLEDNDDLVVGPVSPVVVFEARTFKS